MARPLRIEIADGVYHVTCRGDRREPIFGDDRDRVRLLDILGQALARFDAVALAYCLMNNHYHLVLQTKRANLSRLMRHVNGVYAQAFNRRHDLVGHVFQGRFHAIHVDRDAYLMQVCRYTDLNPVRARLVESPAEWTWSSFRAHCGFVDPPIWLDTDALRGQLLGIDATSAAVRGRAASIYAEFVAAGSSQRLWEEALRQDIYLGGEAFIARTQASARVDQVCAEEIPEVQRRAPQPCAVNFKSAQERLEAVGRAYAVSGMRMREIAEVVGLSVSQVSRLIAQTEGTVRQPLRMRRLRRERRLAASAVAKADTALADDSRKT